MHGEKTLMAIRLAARRASEWLTDENSGLTSFKNRGNVFPRSTRESIRILVLISPRMLSISIIEIEA